MMGEQSALLFRRAGRETPRRRHIDANKGGNQGRLVKREKKKLKPGAEGKAM